jgi:hypothetical protein
LVYQPPANSTFLSEQTNHQQPASNTFLLEQTSTGFLAFAVCDTNARCVAFSFLLWRLAVVGILPDDFSPPCIQKCVVIQNQEHDPSIHLLLLCLSATFDPWEGATEQQAATDAFD